MSNIMGMIFCEAAALGVLLSWITLNTSLLGEMSPSDSERWLLPSAAVKMKNTATLQMLWSQCRLWVYSTVKPTTLMSKKYMNTLLWVISALWCCCEFMPGLQGIPKQTLESKRLHHVNIQCLVSLKIHMHFTWEWMRSLSLLYQCLL